MDTKILRRTLKIKKILPIIVVFFSFFILTNCSAQTINKTTDSKETAVPIKIQGVDNFYKVSETLFRSARPCRPSGTNRRRCSRSRGRANRFPKRRDGRAPAPREP